MYGKIFAVNVLAGFSEEAFMRTVFAVTGLSLAGISFTPNFGLLYFAIAVYYLRGLEHAASFVSAVNRYQPSLFIYSALAVAVGLILYAIAALSEPE